MTVLYDYWRSSAAYRVRIALALAGEPFERVHVDLLKGDQKADANRARNPQGLVPTLEIDGLRLTQSLAICEYLSETRALGLLPDDPAGRARVRAIAYAIAMEIAPVANLGIRTAVAALSVGRVTAEDWSRQIIAPGLAAVETLLTGTGPWCHGDRITVADLCLIPQVYNAGRLNIALPPKVAAIADHARHHPAFIAAHPDTVGPPP
jgi:maleylacetoacetate isomerase